MTTHDIHILERVRTSVARERREAVLDAAIQVIVARGFDATRFSDVAEASGVAVSTLQYYFGSLEALLIETCLLANQRDLKLTSADEDTIRALAETKSLRALAADYGVSHETVRTVLRARVVR